MTDTPGRPLVEVLADAGAADADPLVGIRHLTDERDDAALRARQADEDWRQAIVAAVRSGVTVVDVAEAARISRARVYQIRDGRR